ncbi:19579_t:CDS:2 [Rhizophagus irregularis]|uniref:Uncharacterized protein n=1 Tax=Rhizophagus irregularis (strain DAOM 181602 / DAOM 197198 / MUCL 43194) TaxID=747089 RepID=U9TDZ8_RHIID|nr:19579_t:CDS:2 [Rhizophagus irregularis]
MESPLELSSILIGPAYSLEVLRNSDFETRQRTRTFYEYEQEQSFDTNSGHNATLPVPWWEVVVGALRDGLRGNELLTIGL